MEAINPIVIGFTGCLLMSFLLSELFNRIKYPRILGYIMAGIVFTVPSLNHIFIPEEMSTLLQFLSEVGIVFFLLLAGLEMDITELRKMGLSAVAVGFLAFSFPFVLGFSILTIAGYAFLVAFVTALCLSVTAAAIAVEILMEYGLFKTKEGAVIVGAGMVDDLLGVLSLTFVVALVEAGGTLSPSLVLVFSKLFVEYVAFLLIAYILGFRVYPYVVSMIWSRRSENAVFTLSIVFGLIITLLSQAFGMSSLIGAFIAGLIINLTVKDTKEGKEIVHNLDSLTFGFIIPFFFISVGLKFDIFSVLSNIPLLLILAFIAAAGKFLGTAVAAFITDLPRKSIGIISLGMNARGGIELVVAVVALSQGMIPKSLFSIIITMSFLTTFLGIYLFKRQVKKNMDELVPLMDDTLCKGADHCHLEDM